MSDESSDVRAVSQALASYLAWQDDAAGQEQQGPALLLAVVEAVRALCWRNGSLAPDAVAALRDATGLDFRREGDAVLFELADDKNPGRTQTVAVGPAAAGLE